MNTWSVLYDLLVGFGVTLKLFALTLVIAIPLGLLFAVLAMVKFKPVSYLMKVIIWIVRGTPLLLQCVVVTFIPSVLLKIPNKDFAAALGIDTLADLQFVFVLAAFALNYACYFAVIYEGGIKAIPKGQYEAGQVLGMTKVQTFFRVILLQVIKRIIPSMGNEIITLVKDTALARVIAVYEVTWAGESFIKKGLIWPLFYTGVFYLLFSGGLTLLFGWFEKKLSYFRG